uniref:Uncharacterized protein n=1 Tax=Aegilops tauschii subsp. strangulata TaxID=200361 RepID=A0A452Y561_AEGTS
MNLYPNLYAGDEISVYQRCSNVSVAQYTTPLNRSLFILLPLRFPSSSFHFASARRHHAAFSAAAVKMK